MSLESLIDVPKNIDVEFGLFAIILMNKDAIVQVSEQLISEDFYVYNHGLAWKACLNLYENGMVIDMVSLSSEMIKLGVDKDYTSDFISQCLSLSGFLSNLSEYAKEIKNKALLRRLLSLASNITTEVQKDGADAMGVAGIIDSSILGILDTVKEEKSSDINDVADDVVAELKDIYTKGWKGMNTGFPILDENIGGLYRKHVFLVGAYTGTGKTFFALQTALNMLKQGKNVAIFSMEMDTQTMFLRMVSNIANLGTLKILQGALTDTEKARLKKGVRWMRQYKGNLHMFDNIRSLDEIRLKVRKLKKTCDLDLVIVDYIQSLQSKYDDIYNKMSNISSEAQDMAMDLDVCMMLMSQVDQGSADWDGKGERLGFKGAGDIGAIADVALWITRDKKSDDDSLRKVYIRKARHARRGLIDMELKFPSGQFIEKGESMVDTDDIVDLETIDI